MSEFSLCDAANCTGLANETWPSFYRREAESILISPSGSKRSSNTNTGSMICRPTRNEPIEAGFSEAAKDNFTLVFDRERLEATRASCQLLFDVGKHWDRKVAGN